MSDWLFPVLFSIGCGVVVFVASWIFLKMMGDK